MFPLLFGLLAMAPPAIVAPVPLPRSAPPVYMAPPAPPARLLSEHPQYGATNVMRLFSTDDYPMEAIRREEQGTVTYRATVGIDGRVSACAITSSSGSIYLDAATCNIIQRRARFRPALDQHGQPIEDHFAGRIRWVLPEPDPAPYADLRQATIFTADADGSIATCRYEGTADEQPEQVWCAEMRSIAREVIGEQEDRPMTGREMVFERGLLIGGPESASLVGRGAGQTMIMRTAFALTIDADGKVVDCVDVIGDHDADEVASACAPDRKAGFPPLAADAADRSNRHAVRYMATYTRPLTRAVVTQ